MLHCRLRQLEKRSRSCYWAHPLASQQLSSGFVTKIYKIYVELHRYPKFFFLVTSPGCPFPSLMSFSSQFIFMFVSKWVRVSAVKWFLVILLCVPTIGATMCYLLPYIVQCNIRFSIVCYQGWVNFCTPDVVGLQVPSCTLRESCVWFPQSCNDTWDL